MFAVFCAALAFAEPAPAPAAEWRVAVGAQADADSHGILDLGWRRGAWSVELLTDTVDGRWSPSWDGGRAWVAARVQPFAGQMLISPWVDGAPAPELALMGIQAGPEGGAVAYLPGGLYAGGALAARYWTFAPRGSETTAEVPAPRPVGTADAILGWWRPAAELTIRAGADLTPDRLAPHAVARLEVRPRWVVAPYLLAHGVIADDQDFLLTTRVGGLTPYVVPVAGAAWAEWWAEDVAAARVGPRWQPDWGHIGLVADVAWFDGQTAAGFATTARVAVAPWFADLAVGYAPWIERAPNVGRASVYFLLGRTWSAIRPRSAPADTLDADDPEE
ncbi:MAG: hypothetical protein ACI8PZ_004333 [Myxococcota bacterium]|jgi:hypothetical protein